MGLMTADSSIYQNAPKSIVNYGLQGYEQAMQDKTAKLQQQALAARNKNDLAGYMQTKTENDRHQAYMATLDQITKQGADFNTPDGQKAIISGLQQKGFGQEAIELSQHLPKPAPNSYDFLDTPGGFAAGNKQTGEMKINPDIPSTKREEKQAEDLFGSMKPTLDKFLTPANPNKGWDPLTGEKGRALQKAISYMPANILKSKVAQDWINSNSKEQQQTVFNPMMGAAMMLRPEMSAEARISGQNQKQSGDYEVAKRGALAFKADYDNYKKAVASGDQQAIKVAQQGMVDKYITTSTGKSTGDAQFKNFAEGQGIINALQNLGDKWADGSMAPPKVFAAMNDITMSTAMKLNEKVKQANAMTRRQTAAENKAHGFNLDPESMITHPEDMLSQDSTAFASPSKPNSAIAQPKSKAEKDALPSGTRYMGPDGKVAIKQ